MAGFGRAWAALPAAAVSILFVPHLAVETKYLIAKSILPVSLKCL